jgi:hypothetical protein
MAEGWVAVASEAEMDSEEAGASEAADSEEVAGSAAADSEGSQAKGGSAAQKLRHAPRSKLKARRCLH